MVKIDDLALAASERDALKLRDLLQDLTAQNPDPASWTRPKAEDKRDLAIAASLAELLAERLGKPAPIWTSSIGPLAEPFFLLRSAETLARLKKLCTEESPAPLRKRRLYAPPNFLEYA